MNAFKIHLSNERLWHGSGVTYARGHAYLGDRLLSASSLHSLVSSQESLDGFLHILRQLNGFFAVVHNIGDTLLVAEDHTRSFPLFYSSRKDVFCVSDDPRWIQEQVAENELDELSASEFLLTGYVTGNNTLYPHVKQVQAGEALIARTVNSSFHVQTTQYYQYSHGNYLDNSPEELHLLLDQVLSRVFRRLIHFADGRTMVVPLSGGYDSRLIVLMLKRLDYPRILTFSYGRPGNSESQISEKVAMTLGIPWQFVPYTNEEWSRWYHTEEFERYRRMADGLVSVPHIQDWPAVWELSKRGLIPRDGIFVPGHEPLAGMSLFPLVTSRGTISQDQLISLVHDAYYDLRDYSVQAGNVRHDVCERTRKTLGTNSKCTLEAAADVWERWWWQERAAKFLINSVRAYEFWGYEWWLPLWDSELVEFWSTIPLRHRLHKSLHKAYVRKLEKRIAGLSIREHKPLLSMPPIEFGGRILSKTRLAAHARRMLMLREYDKHPLAWWGILPRNVHRALCTGRGNINSFLAQDTLGTISGSQRENRADL